MVQYVSALDSIFHSLSDATRRDIMWRVSMNDLNISDLAKDYEMSFSAVAKHLRVLEKARLITKVRHGKQKLITANTDTLNIALEHLGLYKQHINDRYDALEVMLSKEGKLC